MDKIFENVDEKGLRAYLEENGIYGYESQIASILNGNPDQSVINDIIEGSETNDRWNVETEDDVKNLSVETLLDYWTSWVGIIGYNDEIRELFEAKEISEEENNKILAEEKATEEKAQSIEENGKPFLDWWGEEFNDGESHKWNGESLDISDSDGNHLTTLSIEEMKNMGVDANVDMFEALTEAEKAELTKDPKSSDNMMITIGLSSYWAMPEESKEDFIVRVTKAIKDDLKKDVEIVDLIESDGGDITKIPSETLLATYESLAKHYQSGNISDSEKEKMNSLYKELDKRGTTGLKQVHEFKESAAPSNTVGGGSHSFGNNPANAGDTSKGSGSLPTDKKKKPLTESYGKESIDDFKFAVKDTFGISNDSVHVNDVKHILQNYDIVSNGKPVDKKDYEDYAAFLSDNGWSVETLTEALTEAKGDKIKMWTDDFKNNDVVDVREREAKKPKVLGFTDYPMSFIPKGSSSVDKTFSIGFGAWSLTFNAGSIIVSDGAGIVESTTNKLIVKMANEYNPFVFRQRVPPISGTRDLDLSSYGYNSDKRDAYNAFAKNVTPITGQDAYDRIVDVANKYSRLTESAQIIEGDIKTYADMIIENGNGELLLLKRTANDDLEPNKLGFAGGKVMQGETTETGAIREAYEECGLNVMGVEKLEEVVNEDGSTSHYFKGYAEGDVTLSEEHDDYKWIKPEEMMEQEIIFENNERYNGLIGMTEADNPEEKKAKRAEKINGIKEKILAEKEKLADMKDGDAENIKKAEEKIKKEEARLNTEEEKNKLDDEIEQLKDELAAADPSAKEQIKEKISGLNDKKKQVIDAFKNSFAAELASDVGNDLLGE